MTKMYITENYWGDYIGGTDDSLNLTAHLAEKGKKEVTVAEIFADFGLDRLDGSFRQHEEPLVYTNEKGWEVEIQFAIDLVTDLAALLLECKVNGILDLTELDDTLNPDEVAEPVITVTAAPEELALIEKTLADFAAEPAEYDLSEMMDEEELSEMADVCEALRKELCR